MSQLLTIPIYVFAAIVLLSFAHYSDKLKLRSPFVFIAQCMALIGFIINITNAPRGPKYFGLFLAVAGAYGAVPGSVTWLGNNLAPTYKRGRFLFGVSDFLTYILSTFTFRVLCFQALQVVNFIFYLKRSQH